MKTIFIFLLFILAIIVHELGHYLGFRLAKRKAHFSFKWGVIYAECEDRLTLTLRQYFSIAMIGIGLGLVVVGFTNDSVTILVYLLACSIDFSIIFSILDEPFKDWNMTLFEKGEKQYLNNKKEMELIKNEKTKNKTFK